MSGVTRRSEVVASSLLSSINRAFARLMDIWNTIGIEEEMRLQRMETVKKHTENLFNEMIEEEENLKERLEKSIQLCQKELTVLSQQLSIEVPTVDEKQTILQKEKNLSVLVEFYASEKNERMNELKQLKEQEEELCNDLCSTPYYIPTGSIPTRQQLEDLKRHIKELSEEKARRFVSFTGLRHQIRQLVKEIGRIPNTTLEKEAEEAVCEDEDVFLLTNENLKALKVLVQQLEIAKESLITTCSNLEKEVRSLWLPLLVPEEQQREFDTSVTGSIADAIQKWETELKRLQELKKEKVKVFIGKSRQELNIYWDRCLFSTEQREAFHPFFSDEYTGEILEEHDKELVKIKIHYEKGKVLFDDIAKRESIWKQFLDLEKKASDPNRFANRGGALLKEEKERSRVQKILPKLEEELKASIEKWEDQHGSVFLVYGQRFVEYIKNQWEGHRNQKERERKQEKVGKKDDATFRTPLKRPNPGNGAQVTPNKTRKLNRTTNPSMLRSTSSCSISGVAGPSQKAASKLPPAGHKTPLKGRVPEISQRTALQETVDNQQLGKFNSPPGSYSEFMKEHAEKSNSSDGLLNSTVVMDKL